MKGKALTILALCALAFPAAGAAHVTIGPHPTNVCGIGVTETETGTGVDKIMGSGVELNAFEIKLTWTNPANGKTVVLQGAQLAENSFASPTDNGDGTISIFTKAAGMSKLTIPNGPPVSINAGQLTGILTLDSTSFEFVSFQVLSLGGSPPVNVDICPAVVSALS